MPNGESILIILKGSIDEPNEEIYFSSGPYTVLASFFSNIVQFLIGFNLSFFSIDLNLPLPFADFRFT